MTIKKWVLILTAGTALTGGAFAEGVYQAIMDFPNCAAGEVPYMKERRNALAINAAIKANRDKFARAEMTYPGATGNYDITITTFTEMDGESTYRLLINGRVAGTYVNPRVGERRDLKIHTHRWSNIVVHTGDSVAIESNTSSNGLIPEGDSFAWARGRWRQLEFTKTAQMAPEFSGDILYRESGQIKGAVR